MNQILRCDWLPERARWSYLARSGLPAALRKKTFPESHIINPLFQACSVKMAGYCPRSFFAGLWTSTPSRSINTQKKELGQYPAILTEQAWSITHTSFSQLMSGRNFLIRTATGGGIRRAISSHLDLTLGQ